jgi:hypothetical protein
MRSSIGSSLSPSPSDYVHAASDNITAALATTAASFKPFRLRCVNTVSPH